MRGSRYSRILCLLLFVALSIFVNAQSKQAIQFYNKGQKSYQQRLLIQASVDYTEAIALHPDYREAIEARGLIFLEIEEDKGAIRDLEKVLQLDPTRLLPKIHLIDLYESLDMHDDGIRISTLMMNKNSKNLGTALMKRGRFYEKAGNIEGARKDYEDFLNINDDYYKQFRKEINVRLREL